MLHPYFKVLLRGLLLSSCIPVVCGYETCPCTQNQKPDMKFIKKVGRFWAFKEESNTWEEVMLPFDLLSCVNGSCSVVGSIERSQEPPDQPSITATVTQENIRDGDEVAIEATENFLPIRKRISVAKLSESSIWVTGPSGSIYERFWNGVHWVIAPHELPISAGPAMSVFVVNQTVLALSEAGVLYELQLNESQQIWCKVQLTSEQTMDDSDLSANEEIKSYAISNNGEILYLSSRSGVLIEVSEFRPLRWTNHGRPTGAQVANIADGDSIRKGAVFAISSTGELFEFDKNSKPPWKKHVWRQTKSKEIRLANSKWCCSSLVGAYFQSLFLLSKDGLLLERQLHQRKWKWVVHGAPQGHNLSAITRIQQDGGNGKLVSILCTASTGSVFEYQLSKHSGFNPDDQIPAIWVNHMHPEHAKVARGVSGIQLQFGRMIFLLDDGRLGELHLSSIGGEDLGPSQQNHIRRKVTSKYEWSILDAPETEGWNAEYCNDEVGPLNCFGGTKVATKESELDASTGRQRLQAHQYYLSLKVNENQAFESIDKDSSITASTSSNFRMRALHPEKSFLYVSESGLVLEYQNDWSSVYGSGIWLQHEYSKAMKGALGNFNGSMYLVDKHDNLLMRERNENGLSWIDCTNMKNGKQVATGAPWDSMPGRDRRITAEDALFFVNKKGKLLQFTVAFRKFKWKDCRRPPSTKIAFIVDQGIFRMNIVFVVGRNGRLYQYNRVTELWHEHYQSPHLVLSRVPGTARRSSDMSPTGSLFMILENGGLVEYYWGQKEGWKWVEHGTPNWDVKLVASPGPCFEDGELFLIGSDGQVYRRYLDKNTWKWARNGHPQFGPYQEQHHDREKLEGNYENGSNQNCNEKVNAVRPIPFSDNSVIFELRDGRLAELRRSEAGADWEWTRIIGTPNSLCPTDYMMALAF